MDSSYNDERISAYLDGELSADEQDRFEERLAENAELRQLVEELRALRGSLDLLPHYRLDPDFAERVLQRAERQMLVSGSEGSGDGRSAPRGAAGDSKQTTPGPTAGDSNVRSYGPSEAVTDRDREQSHRQIDPLDESRRFRWRIVRPLLYAAATIAAAILIMVFKQPAGNELAQNRKAQEHARQGEGDGASTVRSSTSPTQPRGEQGKSDAQNIEAAAQVARRLGDSSKVGKPMPESQRKEEAAAATGVVVARDRSGATSIVANCVASSKAAEEEFLGLLAKNGIAIRDPSSDGKAVYSFYKQAVDRASQHGAAHDKESLLELYGLAADKTVPADGGEAEARRIGAAVVAKEHGDVEIVYVEGSPQQIDSLLHDLKANPVDYRSLTIAPAETARLTLSRQAANQLPAAAGFGGVQQGVAPSDKRLEETLDDRGATRRRGLDSNAAGGGSYGNSDSYRRAGPALSGPLAPSVGSLDDKKRDDTPPLAPKSVADSPGIESANSTKRVADEEAPNVPRELRSLAKPSAADKKPAALANSSAPQPTPPSVKVDAATPPSNGPQTLDATATPVDPAAKGRSANELSLGRKAVSEEKQANGRDGDLSAWADHAIDGERAAHSFAIRIYPVPIEAKQEQSNGSKQQEEKVEDRVFAGGTAAGTRAPAALAAPAGSAAQQPAAPPAERAPASRAISPPSNSGAESFAETPSPSKPNEAKPAAGRATGEGRSPGAEVGPKLNLASKDSGKTPAAMPLSPPLPSDRPALRSESRLTERSGAPAAVPQPTQAIFVFRISPPLAAASPPPVAGPPAAKKAKQ
jgi:anti-sigma factor RsiW